MRRPFLHRVLPQPAPLHSLGKGAIDRINARRREGTIIVLIANGKGGCGKTTLSTNLAVGYGRELKRVLLIDADIEQRSAAKWPRPSRQPNPVVESWSTVEIVEKLAPVVDKYDVVLIDMAGRDDRAVTSVLAIADIMISPTKPSWLDMNELGRFIRVAQARYVPHLVVFNEATREMTGEMRELVKQYGEFGPYLPIAIQDLTSYRRVYALGRGALEITGTDPAKDNFGRAFPRIAAEVARAHEDGLRRLR